MTSVAPPVVFDISWWLHMDIKQLVYLPWQLDQCVCFWVMKWTCNKITQDKWAVTLLWCSVSHHIPCYSPQTPPAPACELSARVWSCCGRTCCQTRRGRGRLRSRCWTGPPDGRRGEEPRGRCMSVRLRQHAASHHLGLRLQNPRAAIYFSVQVIVIFLNRLCDVPGIFIMRLHAGDDTAHTPLCSSIRPPYGLPTASGLTFFFFDSYSMQSAHRCLLLILQWHQTYGANLPF